MRGLLPAIDPTAWMQISAGVFLVVFIALACWVYAPGRAAKYRTFGELPFEGEEHER